MRQAHQLAAVDICLTCLQLAVGSLISMVALLSESYCVNISNVLVVGDYSFADFCVL